MTAFDKAWGVVKDLPTDWSEWDGGKSNTDVVGCDECGNVAEQYPDGHWECDCRKYCPDCGKQVGIRQPLHPSNRPCGGGRT